MAKKIEQEAELEIDDIKNKKNKKEIEKNKNIMSENYMMNQPFFGNNNQIYNNVILNNNLKINNSINNLGEKDMKRFEYNKNVNFYEDEKNEFKQFTINSEKELYSRLRQNMKYFSAFLNSNTGTLYFGINDNGVIKGIELNDELKHSFELELNKIIESYDEHIKKNNNITFFFHEVIKNDEMKISENKKKYVIEINIKVGLPDHIYTTPFKEDDNDDYGCYIKLNGTVKKISGDQLYYYTKNKIMKYVKSLAEKQNKMNI